MRPIWIVMIAIVLSAGNGRAQALTSKVVISPLDGVPADAPQRLAVAYAGTIGFTTVMDPGDFSWRLFSFSTSTGQIADRVDLTADFGKGLNGGNLLIALVADDTTGLVAAVGRDAGAIQKVVMFASDPAGHLSRRWALVLSAAIGPEIFPSVAFNDDGTRLYVDYVVAQPWMSKTSAGRPKPERLTQNQVHVHRSGGSSVLDLVGLPSADDSQGAVDHVALLRTSDGSLSDEAQVGGGRFLRGMMFDKPNNRLIMTVDATLYLVPGDPDHLTLATKIGPVGDRQDPLGPSSLIGLQDGRFLISYGGFIADDSGNGEGSANFFFSTDLEGGTTTALAVNGLALPSSDSVTMDSPARTVLVPYSFKAQISKGSVTVMSKGSHLVDLISIKEDGSLERRGSANLPKTPAQANLITLFNNVVISASGAMAFVSTASGNMFTLDTQTGEVVNRISLDPQFLTYLVLIQQTDKIVFNNGNSLMIMDAPDRPLVSGMTVKAGRSVIRGANFLQGVRVTVNGVDVVGADRSATDPGGELIIPKGKRDFPPGQQFNVVIINRDGSVSDDFVLVR